MLKLGLLGYPVSHSASPAMHNAALSFLGIEGRYEPIETLPGEFSSTLTRLTTEGFTGLNVTLPHKKEAFLLADAHEESAKLAGGANVLYRSGGRWIAANTDGEGLARSLFPEVQSFLGLRIIWLGSGGATLTSASVLMQKGARLTLSARNPDKVQQVAERLGASWVPMQSMEKAFAASDLLVQATSATMHPESAEEWVKQFPLECLPPAAVVCDLVYRPRETVLLQRAVRLGLRVVDGSRMLLHQGALAFRYFTGREAPVEVMEEALHRELSRLV